MKWKLWTRDEGHSPAGEGWYEFDSKEAALNRACDIIRHQRHVKVLYIEEPDGKRIQLEDIDAWCKARSRKA